MWRKMLLSKSLCTINWSPKSILLIFRYQAPADWSLELSMIQVEKILQKKLRMLIKRVPCTSGLVKKIDYNINVTEIEKSYRVSLV